jgi:hypothetical protein
MIPELYYLGLDLGKQQDYTAITISRRVTEGYGRFSTLKHYEVQHIERLPLGTHYRTVAEHVRAIQESDQLRGHDVRVIADTTGVGIPVFEMLCESGVANLYGVTIHGGDAVIRDGHIYRVPKRDLITTTQLLLQAGQVRIAESLPFAETLRHEMSSFQMKITATGQDTFEAWRERDHDDLVLSLAIGLWYAQQCYDWLVA